MGTLPQLGPQGPGDQEAAGAGIVPQIAAAMTGGMDYLQIRTMAIDLINQYGKEVTVVRAVQASPSNPNLPWRLGQGTQTTYTCRAVITPIVLRASRGGGAQPEQYKTVVLPGDVGASSKYGTDGITVIQTDQIQWAGLTLQFIGSPDPYIFDDGNSVILWSGYVHPYPDDMAGI